MNLSDLHFPRQLEADGSAEKIRERLTTRTQKLWAESAIDVPVLAFTEPLKKAIWRARMQARVRPGLENIDEKLAGEKRGLDMIASGSSDPSAAGRVSRLLLFTPDGAERFYRHIEQALLAHAPRILGCRLDIDGQALGRFLTGKSGVVKIIMIEHKDAVSGVLRALLETETSSTGDL